MGACKNLIDMRFGKLTVKEKLGRDSHGEIRWLCVCDCGNEHISTSNRLTSGQTTCCRDCMIKKIGDTNRTHGRTPRKLFYAYVNMKTRCYNKNYSLYHRYGGRGIKVCDEWRNSFENFREWAMNNGWKEELSLDRIDNDGNYEPNNCKWSTVLEQSNNRRTNRLITYNGITDTMANWSRRMNIPYYVIQRRISLNWDIDKVFTEPYRRKAK